MAYFNQGRLCSRSVKILCMCGKEIQIKRKSYIAILRNEIGLCFQHSQTFGEVKYLQHHSESVSYGCRSSHRTYSTQDDLYELLENDLKDIYLDIREELRQQTVNQKLLEVATYYFDGRGKALRPMVVILMARAINCHMNNSELLPQQRRLAMFIEMIHTASLLHDDIVDQADIRRGKPSVNVVWNYHQATRAGSFIFTVATIMVARLRDDEVTIVLTQMIKDLVHGELMQLGSKETENEMFADYLKKTYCKTASLIANSLKAVTMLAGADDKLSDIAFQYGYNIGIAFQLIDDLLDFVSTTDTLGKPTAADLKLGLATAPVLFACEKFPELNSMIMRKFKEEGDVEKAFEMVHKSQGLEQTQFLAKKHCLEAVRAAKYIKESPYQKGLIKISDLVLNRKK